MRIDGDQRSTNRDGLSLLQKGLRAFVEERMRGEYNDRWLEKARLSLGDFRASYSGDINLDVHALIRIATDTRHRTLYSALSPRDRNYLHELRDIRNRHAHQNEFGDREVDRALDTLELFLQAIGAQQATDVRSLRKIAVASTPPIPAPGPAVPVLPSGQLGVGAVGLQRGVRLFRYLCEQAGRGNAVGIGYADFIAFLHGKESFREVARRNYLPSDSGAVIEQAWSVTDANGGRIAVSVAGRTIRCGMDTFIWASSPPYDRPERAWHNPKNMLPYSRADWQAIFPEGLRRLIKPRELAALG